MSMDPQLVLFDLELDFALDDQGISVPPFEDKPLGDLSVSVLDADLIIEMCEGFEAECLDPEDKERVRQIRGRLLGMLD